MPRTLVNQHNSQQGIHYLPTTLRALIIAAGFWVLTLSLTNLSGSIASFSGCVLACFLIDRSIGSEPLARLKTAVLIVIFALLFVAGLLFASLIVNSALLAQLASPLNAYHAGEFVKWLFIAAAVTAALRTCAQRLSWGAVLEIVFVATAFTVTLSAHRNGMIHRPYFIGDYALMRGIDPASILMAMGCGAVLSLAALLMVENNHRRLPWHFGVLGLLCFSLLAYVQLFGLPTPSYTDDLGLTGSADGNASRQQDNPFRDGENNPDNLQAPVAIVLFRDDYEPASGAYYFRETAYSQWNGRLLDITNREDMDIDLVEQFTNSQVEAANALPSTEGRVSVRTSIGLLTPHRRPFGLETPVAFADTPNPNNLRFKRTYDVQSMAQTFDYDILFDREVGAEHWSGEVREEYLQLPDDPRYGELANQLIANLRPEYADDPFAKAYMVKSYLDENGIYSLANEHAYAEDPAASFLFGDLTGYCMHFAFAATYMYRSLGIPARVGIGYSVPASNRAGGSALLIQAIHGHAWPEVYFEGVGWVIIDPAPQQTLVDMTTDPQNNLQQLLGDMLRDEASFNEFVDSGRDSLIPWGMVLNVIYGLVALALAWGYAVKAWRLWLPYGTGNAQQYRISYRAVLDRLSASGLRRRTGESRESFAIRLRDTAPSFQALTSHHLQCALGDKDSAAQDSRNFDWRSAGRHVNNELSAKIPLWRRLLGHLNPYSWLATR